MAATGATPISLYYSATASNVPTAGNLVAGELAINTQDGKLFYKDAAGVVQTIASKDTNSGTFTNISVSGVASFADGTVSLPSITNIGDTNTGIYFPAADTIAFTEGGVESMRIDSSGNVGIGTSSPSYRLDITGANPRMRIQPTTGTEYALYQAQNTGGSAYMGLENSTGSALSTGSAYSLNLYHGGAYPILFSTNANERMRITSAGDVGIGLNSPAYKLDIQTAGSGVSVRASAGNAYLRLEPVFGTGASYIDFVASGSTAQDARIIGGSGSTSNLAFLTGGASLVERMRIDSSGSLCIGTTTSSGAILRAINGSGAQIMVGFSSTQNYYDANNHIFRTANGAATVMSTDSNGNVGIGNSSPNTRLDVYASNPTNGQVCLFRNSAGSSQNGVLTRYSQNGIADWQIGQPAAVSAFTFGTTASEYMRIDSSGNLLVGGTTQRNSAKITNEFSTGNNGLSLYCVANLNAVDFALFSANAGTLCGAISRIGTTSAVVYTATSDYRLKTVIGSVSDAGTRIDALQPIEYDWNTGGRTRGFLAHQFAEVYPSSVTGEKDAVDKEGKPVYQSMQASTAEVMADLIAEIQSLRKRVAQLESK
jgi:hypothetical protein